VRQLLDAGIDVSMFVDPDLDQIRQCQRIRAPKVEINTGKYTEAWKSGRWPAELEKVATAARAARKMGLVVLAGHGLNYRNIDGVAAIADIEELNIGHSIVARAALTGLESAVREMIALMRSPRRLPAVK
jgi:pyridoxine 5-phosphate synthase